MTTAASDETLARGLLTAGAVRERAHAMLDAGLADRLQHFTVHLDKLPAAADFVLQVMRRAYPSLDVPFHARWRHFEAGGFDRWSAYAEAVGFDDVDDMGRAAYDLAIVSVLLDAGAGASWHYADAVTGETYSRSEGLAVASFNMMTSGLFSAVPVKPFRADASALAGLTVEELASGFQVDERNPMVGLDGRAALLNRLGRVAEAAPDVFARVDAARPGGLFDVLKAEAGEGSLPAPRILEVLLQTLGPIWPGRTRLAGVDLGDTWHHPALVTADATSGLVPFHKLSQWLAYSLIEPLAWAGVGVTDVDGLTGLAEYRNGGLFLDTGVIALKDPAEAAVAHPVGSALVVEWRALTVALLDRIAEEIRRSLGRDAVSLPLAKVLEGGTWAAGREIARKLRPGGGPPLTVESDGTVF
ncbi:URC4/urg3 family protein [Chthonobacter rhizosphaerae]|uniref:URC4/urg3 family protein n=1 Tax=Chthonobacter rhizosphaerae TaxID=2735553 RepID=UPI0015EECDA3|nr:URC4/urg3 family protein [Chthonobacter rhizosphaerae]